MFTHMIDNYAFVVENGNVLNDNRIRMQRLNYYETFGTPT